MAKTESVNTREKTFFFVFNWVNVTTVTVSMNRNDENSVEGELVLSNVSNFFSRFITLQASPKLIFDQ